VADEWGRLLIRKQSPCQGDMSHTGRLIRENSRHRRSRVCWVQSCENTWCRRGTTSSRWTTSPRRRGPNLVDFTGDVVTCDVADDIDVLDRLDRFDVIFHEGSITDTTVMDQRKMMHNNVEGFRKPARPGGPTGAAGSSGASSAATYGRGRFRPTRSPRSPGRSTSTATSKLAMEHLAVQYAPRLKHPHRRPPLLQRLRPRRAAQGEVRQHDPPACQADARRQAPRRIFKNGEQKARLSSTSTT